MTKWLSQLNLHKLRSLKNWAILEACLIGLVAGLSAVILKIGIGWLGALRVHLSYLFPGYLILPIFGLVGGVLAGWMVERFAPEASGSGIPQVKAVLAQVPIKMDVSVALTKFVSGTIAIGSGMSLGREGPTVQIGASLAHRLNALVAVSPEHRRQLIAAGAGAGLAAAFHAPIAGVMFVLEELLKDLSSLTIGTAILSSFVASVVSRWMDTSTLDVTLTAMSHHTHFGLSDIPFFLVLGVVAGLLGSFFNNRVIACLTLNSKTLKLPLTVSVGLAGLLSGLLITALPLDFRNYTGLREHLVMGHAGWQIALLAFVVFFALTVIDYGSGAPGGLFAPSLAVGSSLGYLIGYSAEHILSTASVTTYALVGMGAFFSAVCRVPITAIIIVFEMTTDFNLVLPLMLASIVAFLVGEAVFPGSIYDRLLEFRGIRLEGDASAKETLSAITAGEVMSRNVVIMTPEMPVVDCLELFRSSRHRGFPVVGDKKLLGMVSEADLMNVAPDEMSKRSVEEIMVKQPVSVTEQTPLTEVLYLIDHHRLRYIPVAKDGHLVGIITRTDVIHAVLSTMKAPPSMASAE